MVLNKLKYRNEFKHIINEAQAVIMKSRLKALLKSDDFTDENGSYFVRSLYFDTYDDRALAEKYDGVPLRYKYRIRFYNHDPSMIRLENKIKHLNSTSKLNARLTKEEVEYILNGNYGFLKNQKNQKNWENPENPENPENSKDLESPVKQSFYQELTGGGLVPQTAVDYVRTPFVYPHGNVRITIDSDIRCPVAQGSQGNNFDIFNPNTPTVSVFPDGRCVMEVKYDEFIPDFINKIVRVENAITAPTSKYALCRKFV